MSKMKTSAELRAEFEKQKAKAEKARKAMRAAERREAKERAAAKAEADRRLADALLAVFRTAYDEDVTAEEMVSAASCVLARRIDGVSGSEWALDEARKWLAEEPFE